VHVPEKSDIDRGIGIRFLLLRYRYREEDERGDTKAQRKIHGSAFVNEEKKPSVRTAFGYLIISHKGTKN